MSDQHSTTKYRIHTNALDSGGVHALALTTGDGWDDQFAAQVDKALRALTWPANCQFIGVEKVVTDTTVYGFAPMTPTQPA